MVGHPRRLATFSLQPLVTHAYLALAEGSSLANMQAQHRAYDVSSSMQERLVEAQLGNDPGQAHPAARLQWSTLCRTRIRSLHVDAAIGTVDVLGLLVAKARVSDCCMKGPSAQVAELGAAHAHRPSPAPSHRLN